MLPFRDLLFKGMVVVGVKRTIRRLAQGVERALVMTFFVTVTFMMKLLRVHPVGYVIKGSFLPDIPLTYHENQPVPPPPPLLVMTTRIAPLVKPAY